MININHLTMSYSAGTDALSNLNMTIEDGEFVYLIGKTGAGKSTLIKLLNHELIPQIGSIYSAGFCLNELPPKESYLYRRQIGVVFQNLRFLPKKTIRENLYFVGDCIEQDVVAIKQRIFEVATLVGLEDRLDAYPHELSGGQLQRMAIARAIMNRPKLLIADEPTANLDPITKQEILDLLEKINQLNKTTILVVTHDTDILSKHPHRTCVLDQGCLIEDFSIQEAIQQFAQSKG